jgi:hypothetical protein
MNIQITNSFEKKYKTVPDVVRKQIKLVIRKLANNPSDKSLKTKLIEECESNDKPKPNDKRYESFINSNYKMIWKCNKNNCILILDISNENTTSDTLNKLCEFDSEIKMRESKSREKEKNVIFKIK